MRAGLTVRVEVGKKGVVVIPKAIRDLVGVKEGDLLRVSVVDGKIVLEPEKRVDVDEIRRATEEHRRRVSYARRAELGEMAGVSLEEEFD